ncbi:MAG: SpoIIE family protein phosphatase [Chloroflexi bacterium]|nr:SpoIIE family protein phosphatase [Chloroflexota bacterium]MBU1750269.1 SpoIIE family protein phosphatase [Chloroflexota bacterium]MBU1879841.1 SpoIIE family protein phosphatase [Chloroflexota bacterium]
MIHRLAETAKGNILIVDDNPANLHLLSQMLSDEGYQARPVPDGPLALVAAWAELPDLILLDIRMPEMDGYEVCEHLKADPQARDIPIIFLSALNELQDKIRAFAVGGVDYITKPFQFQEVLARVETHLALRNLQKQLQEANKTMAQELALAGHVQASFLPSELPVIPGWQLTAMLQPARKTSGDFYDVIPLPQRRIGLLIADVVDKGAVAALYMVLSWILVRTYAEEHPTQPAQVLTAVNRRLLLNTQADQFVTVFYGVLDPATATLTYCNAGHNPPYLVRSQNGSVQALRNTGPMLGILEGETWEQGTVQLAPGDVLVLYTDGVTDAEREPDVFFGKDRLLATVQDNLGRPAADVHEALIAAVNEFVDGAAQTDDMALMIVSRDQC